MKITLNKNQWELIGKKTGWFRKAQVHTEGIADTAKEVICDSGKKGWQDKLQNIYSSLEELISYNEIYGICKRLGYEDPAKCWEDNPTIQGSIDPSDLKKVEDKTTPKHLSPECTICDGKGYIQDYEDKWKCRACDGTGFSVTKK
jgi:hypothetical protein